MSKRETGKKEGEEVSEIFEIEKDGKKEIIETHTIEDKKEEKPVSEEQIKKENNLFRSLIIVMAGFALMFFAVYMITNSMRFFEVEGVSFEIVKEGALTFYKTSLPVIYQGNPATYNFYLRNDPRSLKRNSGITGNIAKERVSLIGNITFRKNLVLDVTTQDLYCAGDWAIGLINIQNLYKILDINLLIKNSSTIYSPINDYMFITINKGNQTEIKQISGYSYEMNVANCEILPAFEKLMLESFIRNKELNE